MRKIFCYIFFHYFSFAATKPKMRTHYRGHKMALWLNLIPQLHKPGDPEVSMRHHHFREREPHFYAGKLPKFENIIYIKSLSKASGDK